MPDQEEAAEFAALVAELSAEETAEETDSASEEPEEIEESEDVEETDDDSEVSDETSKDDEEEKEESLEASLTAEEQEAAKLFLSGSFKEACKRLGVDPAIFKVKPREFTAMRKGLREAEQKARQGATLELQGRQLTEAAQKTYGPIVAGAKAYREGDAAKTRAAIEIMFEDSFEHVMAMANKAGKSLSPAEAELAQIRQERAEEKRAQEAAAAATVAAQQEAKEVQTLSGRLKGTPLERVPDAAKEIRALVVASFDGVGYGLTVKDAYAQVKTKYSTIAEAVTGKKLSTTNGQRREADKLGKKRSELAPLRREAAATPAERAKAAKAAELEEFRLSVREASAAGNRHGVRRDR